MRIYTLPLLAVLVVGFSACEKDPIAPPVNDPEPVIPKTTMKRTYIVSDVVKSDTSYLQGDSLHTKAYYQGSRLFVDLPFGAKQANAYQDGINFGRDTTQLQPGLTGTFSLNTADYPNIWLTSYLIGYMHPDGYQEFRYAVAELGYDVKGELKIESYDAQRKLISGSYKVEIGNLGYHPLKEFPVLTTEPTVVKVEGTFKDVTLLNYNW